MPEDKKEEDGKQEEQKPTPDAFGTPRTPDGQPVEPVVPEKKEEAGKDGKPVDKKEGEGTPVDIENHPYVKELKAEVERVKNELGGNLSGQRSVIEKLEEQIKELTGGKKTTAEPLFKDIKRVKDYSKEEQEQMTDTEKRLIEENADVKERLNAQHQAEFDRQQREITEGKAADEIAKANEELSKKVQPIALRLANNDVTLANNIIATFNEFAGNDKLDEKGIAERMEKAARATTGYKPPREQPSPRGKAAGGSGVGDDKFGTDKIIEEASARRTGGYAL